MKDKLIKGQFFTKENYWLKQNIQIIDFIHKNTNRNTLFLDPFCGPGYLFETLKNILNKNIKTMGFDIDNKMINNLNVFYNDSLVSIIDNEKINNNSVFIVTNPPYLSLVSSKKQKIYESVSNYFKTTNLNDLYKIALDNIIKTNKPGLAIIPESFINSKLFIKLKNKINLITTIIPNPFEDTQIPICIVCFNGKRDIKEEQYFYINNKRIYSINKFIKLKDKINKYKSQYKIVFNSSIGQIGLKAIDSTSKKDIKFINAKDFNYPKENIKISSRVMTYLYIDEELLKNISIDEIINEANIVLKKWRIKSKDLIFTAFKGNISNLSRRRRLDYKTARLILEQAISNLS